MAALMLLVSALLLISPCLGYKFLFISIHLKSHVIEQALVARELVSRGHEVYMGVAEDFAWNAVTDPAGIKLVHYRQDGEVLQSAFTKNDHDKTVAEMIGNYPDQIAAMLMIRVVSQHSMTDCETMMRNSAFLEELKSHKFDMAVVDSLPAASCSAIIPFHLGIPFTSMCSVIVPAAAVPMMPSFVPIELGDLSDKMTFFKRLLNLILHVAVPLNQLNSELIGEYPDPDGNHATEWLNLQSKSVLFITTRNHFLEWPAPSMPHYITLPGITQRPAKPLPLELEQFMEASEDGVVLVSFGSILNHMNKDMMSKLFEAFGENQHLRFLFRLSEMDLKLYTSPPGNVHLLTWFPQNDILGHPKTKAFITHCGNNGQHEALYHGVPMIGLPIFGDQFHNCFRIDVKELGVCLDTNTFSAEEMNNAIRNVTSNLKIRRNVKKLSTIMREQPLPTETAAYWIEHVTKYGGEHLRSSALDLPWYKYWMFDILLFLLITFVIIVFLLVLCIKRLGRWLKGKEKSD